MTNIVLTTTFALLLAPGVFLLARHAVKRIYHKRHLDRVMRDLVILEFAIQAAEDEQEFQHRIANEDGKGAAASIRNTILSGWHRIAGVGDGARHIEERNERRAKAAEKAALVHALRQRAALVHALRQRAAGVMRKGGGLPS